MPLRAIRTPKWGPPNVTLDLHRGWSRARRHATGCIRTDSGSRTFVSAAGNDSNPCSFAAPCRHFQAAVNATSLGGEVDALDPAGYSPIVISQAITIEGQGWSYIAPPPSGNAITINAVSGNVVIHGAVTALPRSVTIEEA